MQRSPAFVPFVIAAVLTVTIGAHAQSRPSGAGGVVVVSGRTWNGGGGNTKWSTAANWTPGLVPSGHEGLTFPAVINKTAANDMALNVAGNSVDMLFTASGYEISGNAVPMCQLETTYGTGTSAIYNDLAASTICPSGAAIEVATGGKLILAGQPLMTNLSFAGGGRIVMTSPSSILAVHFTVDGPEFRLESDKGASDLALTSGIFSGSGTIGAVTATGGTISPEAPAGFVIGSVGHPSGLSGTTAILHTGNLSANASTTFAMRLAGTTAGTGYDQIQVTGTVSLGGASFSPTVAFAPAAGTVLRIIDNDGVDPIVGTFSGLPEGAVGTLGGVSGRISYVGGTGNDFTLTVLSSSLSPAIVISPASLPALTVGVAVNQTLSGSGGSAPYVFTVTGGALPAGLSLSAGGVLTGTPTTPGSYSFTVTATDNLAAFNTATYSGVVAAGVPVSPVWITALLAIALVALARRVGERPLA